MPVAHLGHVELRTPELERSRDFFTEVIGLFVTEADERSVHLRAWQDFDHHTLTITRADEPGVEHVGWRVESRAGLGRIERRLRELGVEHHWAPGGTEPGQGDGLRFTTPQGLPFELYWEVEPFVSADPELDSRLPSHPQRFTNRGAAPRRFDHVNFLVDDVAAEQRWLTDALGIHHRYFLDGEDGSRLGSWLSRTNISHEIALMRSRAQDGARFHHAGYYMDSPNEVVRAATMLADAGIEIEWGPGLHGTSGAMFLYFYEPSGNRIELWTGGFLIFAPDWQPLRWEPEIAQTGLELWGSDMPDSYLTYGTALARASEPASAG